MGIFLNGARCVRVVLLVLLLSCNALFAGLYSFGDVTVDSPSGWSKHQQAKAGGTEFLGLKNGSDYFRIYFREGTSFDLKQVFTGQVTHEGYESLGPLSWNTVDLKHQPQNGRATVYLRGFYSDYNGRTYFGFARSSSENRAAEIADSFLKRLLLKPVGKSLTGSQYNGKKYYLGFGDHLSGFMGNEVKYDIKHTHDIFTKKWGGDYLGFTLLGSGVGASDIRSKWQELGSQMNQDDMYVQYSSGHGSHSGLMIGVRYDDIRDNALSYPAREIIVFTMACYSGNLVNSFNKEKAQWENFENAGRTLYVMSSSEANDTSSTGPHTDSDEPDGPNGSAGSAFGHALWKALIGYADGFIDGVKDGFVSLGEIKSFTIWKTQKVGGHTPLVTGVFNEALIMNQVPSAEVVRLLESNSRTSEGLSDVEVMRQIEELDLEFRINR